LSYPNNLPDKANGGTTMANSDPASGEEAIGQSRELLRFITDCERLKREYRHCLLSDGSKEDVAAHTWRTTLMILLLEPYIPPPINVNHVLKMLVVHDLVEIYAGDVPAPDSRGSAQTSASKRQREEAAADLISHNAKEAGPAMVALWREFEEQKTAEARLAKSIDKLEAQLQHNEAGVETWEPVEVEMIDDLLSLPSNVPIIAALRDEIVAQARQLVGIVANKR
jgi:5'-deoxynucleotidase YfbR-like HD superfamily hydrolase